MGKVLLENKSDIKNRETLEEGKNDLVRSTVGSVLLPNLVRWLGGMIH